ncbi:MAG TPA: T9SS type A sorting domain-containing protein [Bacteroidia bacterium]|nr:T9SS type A sorting domain-containing protein [Bacteroidia bacterium]
MIKRLLLLIAIIASISSQAQTFPYLNASTGNENEFPVDKDTNIYMFHGDRLVKTDKNFNVIWANTYSGLSFSNLLLSKTGSIYFVAKDNSGNYAHVGKILGNGSLSWVIGNLSVTIPPYSFTSVGFPPNSIMLDRNNNLIVSGLFGVYGPSVTVSTNFYLKLDTNGVSNKLRIFKLNSAYRNFSIASDSSGMIKFVGSGGFMGDLGIYRYNDFLDQFSSCKRNPGRNYDYFYRSKSGSDYYLLAQSAVSTTSFATIMKLDENSNFKWANNLYTSSYGSILLPKSFEENVDGSSIVSVATTPYAWTISSGCIRLDKNGVPDNYFSTMFNGYWGGSLFRLKSTPRIIYKGNYYYDVLGDYYPNNPLTIQKLDSNLNYSCGLNVNRDTISTPAFSNFISEVPTIVSISGYTISLITASVSVSPFSINQNYCLVMNSEENLDKGKTNLSPNPAHSKLVIHANDKIESVEVYDISGKLISTHSNTNEIDVSELTQGMYFLRMNFGNEIVTKKFIKE